MRLPDQIPTGARLVVRVAEAPDQPNGRMAFRDYIGHVRSWNGRTLAVTRDATANGRRPEQEVSIDASTIVALKPIPERRKGAMAPGSAEDPA
ncbi:hypothetical protein BACT_0870 [Bifidobacterium actinocoloniiforme DSM 22766]|uniref:Uncharacterized protein n=1 Tax=Bifidobacterium actinocoloniiforme DSM 22766 TaxID=1437605 RepID=A0A086Z0W8_9BIFI|nr:DUF6725 family protein [Bifidobacterium actinocoloniiforme]AKV55357.1 hypothetical protein AB656_02955 [Bifidobacterium actinocoloniiforme DSM 22766]KFI40168.1 hypothetical protein BACT_0870 [Bifidobacterium actinocoloniiforme DSM 22766]